VSDEDALFWLCCRSLQAPVDPEALDALAGRVDWDVILSTCIENRATVWVADQVLHAAATPAWAKARFAAEVETVARAVRKVTMAFEEAVPTIVQRHEVTLLRGIAYAHTIYKRRVVRRLGDIDLLIDTPTVASISGLLNDHHHVPQELRDRWPMVRFEYHHDLNACWGVRIASFDMRELWARRRLLQVNGCSVGVLAAEDDFTYLCFHNVVKGFVRVYRFVDLLQIAKTRDLDWNVIIERAHRYGVSGPVWINCVAVNQFWPGTVPLEVVQAVKPAAAQARLLLHAFSGHAILHDPNPALRNEHSSRILQFRKVCFVQAALLRKENIIALTLACAVRLLTDLYSRVYAAPLLGAALRRMRTRFRELSAGRPPGARRT
jgi:hypothetical protein